MTSGFFTKLTVDVRWRLLGSLFAGALASGECIATDIYGRVFDTMRGEIYAGATIVLGTQPAIETVTNIHGQYRLRDVTPGVYLVRITVAPDRVVTSRLVVRDLAYTLVANLDLARIEPPGDNDQY